MKKLISIPLMLLTIFIFSATSNVAQVAPENTVKIEAASGGIALVGTNSSHTQAGPYFGGTIAYGVGHGVTVFAESGYGWTNYDEVDKLRLVQIPILLGATYNFGQLLNSDRVQPYAGISAGASNYLMQIDGNTVTSNGYEQKSTNFTAEGILGLNFRISPAIAINISGKYSHGFKKDGNPADCHLCSAAINPVPARTNRINHFLVQELNDPPPLALRRTGSAQIIIREFY